MGLSICDTELGLVMVESFQGEITNICLKAKRSLLPFEREFDQYLVEDELLIPTLAVINNLTKSNLNIPFTQDGTNFQKLVWNAIRNIPYGTTASYVDIAKEIGYPKAYRAVANACAKNRLAILIPCHRVIRCDGNLGGYRWGIDLKSKILDRERKFSENI